MKKVLFNESWRFCLNEGEVQTVDLPHDFSIGQARRADAPSGIAGGYFPGGYGQYEKSFTAKRRKKYFFLSDGSFGITEVRINNNLVVINKYGYNSFYADLTEYLRYDRENTLKICVNNKWQPNARWYTGSGLYRDVFLCECDRSYLHPFGPFVFTESVCDGTAYMGAEVRFHAAERGEGSLSFAIYADGKRAPVHTFEKRIYATEGENKVHAKFQLEKAKLWNVGTPNVYTVKVTLHLKDSTDTDSAVFGVRTVLADSKKGLLINGIPVKLRGGCIHHDHGPLGAAVYPEAEYRRIALLKEAGFNAIRLSHNPQSRHLYDACDRLGMLVIDELFDYWTDGKLKDDFHAFFEDNYKVWSEQIVLRNRSHPSIIMWSTGNEIPQKTGRGYGYEIARTIADTIRACDPTRLLTHGLCSLWDDKEEFAQENATKEAPATEMDYFAERTAITADTVDVVGYNYLEYRTERDLARFPDRLILNTETFPLCAFTTTAQLKDNPRIIGDCVWTAWDYFGETGIGHVNYHYPEPDDLLADRHPNHIANCGDIDICGERKPQSYYRELAWGLRTEPYIACTHPSRAPRPYTPSGWGFYDCEPSWCFEGWEGKPTVVYVFADCDEVVLEINGQEIGRQSRTENGIYRFDAEYQPGKIVAHTYRGGKPQASSMLVTEGKAERLCLTAEASHLAKTTEAPVCDILYVQATLLDGEGRRCTQGDVEVHYEATGADILGVGNAHLTDETLYTSPTRRLHQGKSTLVLKRHRNGIPLTLTATVEGLPTATLVLE